MSASSKAWGEGLLGERARRLAERPDVEERIERKRVCVVEAGGALYGLPVEEISRVIPYSPPAPLANTEASLLGIISRGGGFALVYDLAALVDGRSIDETVEGHLILLRQTRPLRALKVAHSLAILDIEVLSAEEAQSLPARAGIAAYGRHGDNRIVSILDIAALVTTRATTHTGG